MKKLLILIQIVCTIILSTNFLTADIERRSTSVYLNTADCPGKPNFKTKYIVEYIQKNILLRRTKIDCDGNIWVTEFDNNGQPINSAQIGTVPTNQPITNYNFQYSEVNGVVVSWVLTASTQTSLKVYIVESMNGTLNVAYPIPPVQHKSLTSLDNELDICDGLCLKIQPMPAKDFLNLSINENSIRNFNIDNCEVTIGSIDAGMLLKYDNVDLTKNQILSMDISKLVSGSYFVSVNDNLTKKTIGTIFIKD